MNTIFLILVILVIMLGIISVAIAAYHYDLPVESRIEQTDLDRKIIQIKNDLVESYLKMNK